MGLHQCRHMDWYAQTHSRHESICLPYSCHCWYGCILLLVRLLSSLRNLGKLNKAASCAASKRLDDVAYNLCQSAFGFTQTSVRRCNLLAAGTTCHGYNIVISLLAIIG